MVNDIIILKKLKLKKNKKYSEQINEELKNTSFAYPEYKIWYDKFKGEHVIKAKLKIQL